MQYLKRIADELLRFKLQSFGAVSVVGPKACGKTTTAEQICQSEVRFQDEDERDALLAVAKESPSHLLIGKKPRLFDEWQDAPKIWGAVRESVDETQENGLYVLTGSSSSSVDVPHTGTGRISELMMYPMSLYESEESNGSVSLLRLFDEKKMNPCHSDLTIDELIFAICRGGWPRSLVGSSKESQLAVAEDIFYQTCHKDILAVDKKRRNPAWAKKILRSYSRNICTLAETKTLFADVSASTGMSIDSYYDYFSALEKLFVIDEVEAWCPAIRSKEAIRRSNKRNLVDPSLAVNALGISPEFFNADFKTLGFLFESLCIRDLKIYSSAMRGEMSYYHDRYGLEADGVLHLKDGRYALMEFKLGSSEIDSGAKHLLAIEHLISQHNEEERQVPIRMPDLKIIVTGGAYGYQREDGVFVIPIGCLKD